MKLEDLRKDALVTGLDPRGVVTIISVDPMGESVAVVFRHADGSLSDCMLSRADEARLSRATVGRPWGFDADGGEFKLAAESMRIKLAHLFDPMMAVHTSNVEPLPHQISAVYESMLPRQPLRFVLADDPGAGKTVMAGLLVRELMMRSDARRVMIVAPGSLAGQWQDELREKFGMNFEIFSREKQEASASGNYFADQDRLIVRLDQLARNEQFREKLGLTHWDLVIVDEAHKMSASYFSGEIKTTHRFELGQQLSGLCRHLLLMTATPHNGKDEDFQLFMSLLDEDRFFGRFREGVHRVDVSDLMRRMVKEKLLKFDGSRLFPDRFAYSANYELSPAEAALYDGVSTYVREEMNRADRLDGNRRGTVGFALTQLQRRLASSPAAIHKSLQRRRKRLQEQLEELKVVARSKSIRADMPIYLQRMLDLPEDLDDAEDELSPEEFETYTDQVVSQVTTADTLAELEKEIISLQGLEEQARAVVQSGRDSKWNQLSAILQDHPEMIDAQGRRRKLIVFTEHRDTLEYLRARIGDCLGDHDAVVTIHGGTSREQRADIQGRFRQDKTVLVLVATDAAGEGVNLQNASLMFNYDLPWNPNRIEQRFGRIHRIGQREVCHLWNLIARGTREGAVFERLFEKLETEREALGGQVFDILGEAFDNVSLKELLLQAIRYSELPETRAKLDQVIDGALDREHLKAIMQRNALVDNVLSPEHLFAIREEMEKAEARKLQPYFLRGYFLEALQRIGGEARRREGQRYELPHVPAALREHDRQISETRTKVQNRYERICFDKGEVHADGRGLAELVHPAHPLMAALIDLTLVDCRATLKQGAILVDPGDPGDQPALLLLIEHSVREGSGADARVLSQRLQFVRTDAGDAMSFAGWAPHLDLVPIRADERALLDELLEEPWLASGIETRALRYAAAVLAPAHFDEVRGRREQHIDKTLLAVKERLGREITHLVHRAEELRLEVAAGRQPRQQPENLRRRAEELEARLESRMRELEAQRHVVSATPVIVGGALVVPQGLLVRRRGGTPPAFSADAAARSRIEQLAMQAVIAHEESLGHTVKDVSAEKCGWDLTAQPPPRNGIYPEARHIEVKGRIAEADVITVTRNEICTALNQGEKFWLAIVRIDGDRVDALHYVRQPFRLEPETGVISQDFRIAELLTRA